MGAVLRLPRGSPLVLDGRFHVMGVINCTPDSFWAGSRAEGADRVAEAAARMIAEGATVLDLGGESTRPGADYVTAELEAGRVVPAVRAIRERVPGGDRIAISVDTRKASVAEAALEAGADIVNDVSALLDDPALAGVAARFGAPVVLMHKKGVPATMQDRPWYGDCAAEVAAFLAEAAGRAGASGVRDLILDPGIGFGKRLEDNLALLAGLDRLAALGYPVLVGLSRKSFVGALTGREPADRLPGTLAADCLARSKGATFFRVHDVRETVDALKVWDAVSGRVPA